MIIFPIRLFRPSVGIRRVERVTRRNDDSNTIGATTARKKPTGNGYRGRTIEKAVGQEKERGGSSEVKN